MALLTTTSTTWNNWATGDAKGAFVAFVRNIIPYLSRRADADAMLQVGEPKTIAFPAAAYQPAVHFDGPGGDASSTTLEATADGKDIFKVTYGRTATSGFYTAQLTTRANKAELRPFAVNVDPAEGDLRAMTGSDLNIRLAPELKYQFDSASNFETKLDETQGRNLGDSLIYILVVVLALELLLAWSCSYHVSAPSAASRMPSFGGAKGGMA